MINLTEILKYDNPDIIDRYNRDYPNNTLSANSALKELIKYLWISKKHQSDRNSDPQEQKFNFICSMHPEMREIDDMWHTFLLFTKDYASFCQQCFGEFMHHTPRTARNTAAFHTENFEEDFTRYLSYIYENLGEKTLRQWFKELL